MVEDLRCINHPGTSTRLRCSNCDRPICVKCIVQTPVGMKCPDCAKTPLRVRIGKPKHFLSSIAAGIGTAAGCGLVLGFLSLGFFGFLLPLLVGLLVGEVVYRTSGRSGRAPFRIIAAAATVLGLSAGLLVLGAPPALLIAPAWLLPTFLAAVVAAMRAGG